MKSSFATLNIYSNRNLETTVNAKHLHKHSS